jgi:aryl-alcohol dehydrogenase-like predicted oxidoreductase
LEALDTLVRSGKVRYMGSSNYSGWQLMKALGISEKLGLQRYISQQIHYTLQAREAEYELVVPSTGATVTPRRGGMWRDGTSLPSTTQTSSTTP